MNLKPTIYLPSGLAKLLIPVLPAGCNGDRRSAALLLSAGMAARQLTAPGIPESRESVADQHSFAEVPAILDLGQQELGEIGTRNLGNAPERQAFADPIMSGPLPLGEGDGVYQGPLQPALAEGLLSSFLIGIQVAQQRADKDSRQRWHILPGLAHTVRRCKDQARYRVALHLLHDSRDASRHEPAGPKRQAHSKGADHHILTLDRLDKGPIVGGDISGNQSEAIGLAGQLLRTASKRRYLVAQLQGLSNDFLTGSAGGAEDQDLYSSQAPDVSVCAAVGVPSMSSISVPAQRCRMAFA